jgi:hypothetical protein
MNLSTIRFGVGSHDATTAPTGNRDLCIMEAVAYMAGEPWSDKPACASPVIAACLRTWNDTLSDEDRDRLLPAAVWVPRLVGSRGDDATEERRSYFALDWLVRVHTPAWLDLVPSLAPHAAALRALPEIVGLTTAEAAGSIVRAAVDAAGDAAGDAAVAAAGDAGWDAAWAAARAAARAAAWAAARDAARDAAGDAARAAAVDAAGDAASAAMSAARAAVRAAAGDAFRPTVDMLQHSAIELVSRMLACGEHRREEKP